MKFYSLLKFQKTFKIYLLYKDIAFDHSKPKQEELNYHQILFIDYQ